MAEQAEIAEQCRFVHPDAEHRIHRSAAFGVVRVVAIERINADDALVNAALLQRFQREQCTGPEQGADLHVHGVLKPFGLFNRSDPEKKVQHVVFDIPREAARHVLLDVADAARDPLDLGRRDL